MILYAALLLLISNASASILLPRANTNPTCHNLQVESNNGNRKVAVVIDSSGSMLESDPSDLRLSAGRALVNNWLISSKQAKGSAKPDLVTVISFDSSATLDYPLGDPGGANSSFDQIPSGGTFIAGGVQMAIEQLTESGSGDTAGRSAILVFTDGEDSSTTSLVDQIDRAAGLGIRVSFGFLDSTNSLQDKSVLLAIGNSGGIYYTIFDVASSNQFINLVLVNGLTKNDNPQGSNSTLTTGLSLPHFISGSQTQSITYNAQSGEIIDFTIQSIDAGSLDVRVMSGSQTLNSTTVNDTQSFFSSSEPSHLVIHSPGDGKIDIKVTANNAVADSMFVVGAESNMPVQNCIPIVGDRGGGNSKKRSAIAAGVTVPIIAIAALAGAFYWWKHLKAGKPAQNADGQGPPVDLEKPPPPENGTQAPQNKYKHHRLRFKRKNEDHRHHHHLDREHPCYDINCPLSDPSHTCQDPNTPCVCEDGKCALNEKDHKCQDDRWQCPCIDEECPVNKEKKKERRRITTQNAAISGVSAAFNAGVRYAG